MHEDLDLRDFRDVGRLFPLPGVVLFPHVVLPLHIFEPRYRQMMEHALAGDRLLTIVQVRPDAVWDVAGNPALEEVGCLGRIVNHERLPDGRFNLLLLGRKRVRLRRELPCDTLYRQAELEILEDLDQDPQGETLSPSLQEQFRALMASHGPLDRELDALLNGAIPQGMLTDILAHTLALPPALKQQLLAEPAPGRRAAVLAGILGRAQRESRPGTYPPPFSTN
jgi:Lon protease-like protein